MREPVYLDRDGVLNENVPDYVTSLDRWVPIPGALEAAAVLSMAGHPVVVVTNQSAVGRGLMTASAVEEINSALSGRVAALGGRLAGVYHCPHRPEEGCLCRKPGTGMVDSARRDLDLPAGGWIVGDAASDMEMGRRAGLGCIMVLTGRGGRQLPLVRAEGWRPLVAEDMSQAAILILSGGAGPHRGKEDE